MNTSSRDSTLWDPFGMSKLVMNKKMNKYQTGAIFLGILLLLSVVCFSYHKKPEPNNVWRTFTDYRNNWNIEYPSEVLGINIISDSWTEDSVAHVSFASSDVNQEIFSVFEGNTKYKDLNELIMDPNQRGLNLVNRVKINGIWADVFADKNKSGEKDAYFIVDKKLFIIHTAENADVEKIWDSFRYLI